MEESVRGGAKCEVHARGGAVQLAEVQQLRDLTAGMAGGCPDSSRAT